MQSFDQKRISRNSAVHGAKLLRSRRGSFVEATMVLPLTVLLIVSLMGLMMRFYGDFCGQLDRHAEELADLAKVKEVKCVRLYDKVQELVQAG